MEYSITGLLYDILFAAVLIFTAAYGWKRGFISALILLVGAVVAVFGAVWVAQTFAPGIYDNYVGTTIAQQVSDTLAANGGDAVAAVQGMDFLPESIRAGLVTALTELSGEAAPQVAAVLEPVILPMIQVILFLVSCIVIRWAFRALAWTMRGCNSIPLVGGLNRVLGLVFGALSGALNCWLLSMLLWLLSMLTGDGIEFLRSTVLGQSAIYSLLSGFNPFIIHY